MATPGYTKGSRLCESSGKPFMSSWPINAYTQAHLLCATGSSPCADLARERFDEFMFLGLQPITVPQVPLNSEGEMPMAGS